MKPQSSPSPAPIQQTAQEMPACADISRHILPAAANLVGVCIMSLSLVKLLPRHGWTSWVDEMLAIDSLIFLVSVALSYASLRVRRDKLCLETWAERLFLSGLILIILASLVLAFGVG